MGICNDIVECPTSYAAEISDKESFQYNFVENQIFKCYYFTCENCIIKITRKRMMKCSQILNDIKLKRTLESFQWVLDICLQWIHHQRML